jgi:RNA-directed DNA polymerase
MDDRRQKNQLELAFMEESRSEAPMASEEGTESSAGKRGIKSPAILEQLMEEVCERENCKQALKRVRANKGSAGVDGMTVQQLPEYLKQHWRAIREQLWSGTYEPQPVRRVGIPKPDGGVRKLGIPTVLDRFIQQAVMQVLQGRWDRTFSNHSYGFRPGRSAHQAVQAAQQYIAEGYRWCVDLDLEKFFDRVSHDKLMARIEARVSDRRVLKLIRSFLKAGVMEGGLVSPVDEGTPQGGPLSPLLSNIVLDEFDRELERRGLRFARYADESAVARPWERKFLGFSFTANREPKRRIAPKAVIRCKEKVRELTRRTRGVSTERMAEELSRYLRGWIGYFGKCQTPSVLEGLEEWTRRRLRSAIWKQWKRGSVRFAELRKRDVKKDLAARTAGSAHGPWRLAHSPALAFALPNAYFDSLGIPRLTGGR